MRALRRMGSVGLALSLPCCAELARPYFTVGKTLRKKVKRPQAVPSVPLANAARHGSPTGAAADSGTHTPKQPIMDTTPMTRPTDSPLHVASASTATENAGATTSTGNSVPPTADSLGGEGEQSFTKRMFASWQQGVVASIGAAMGVGFLIYVLYAPVKEDTVHHTAMVASEALADLRIKKQAVNLSKEVVASVLQDPKSVQLASQLVVTLLAQEETKVAISSLLQSLFEDHYTQEVTKKFVLRIVRDPWIEDQVQSIVREQVLRLLEDDEIKLALSQFLLDAAADSLSRPDLHYTTARAARSTLARFFNPWWSL